MDRGQGQIPVPIARHDPPHLPLTAETPAGVLRPERPRGRHGGCAREAGPAAQYAGGGADRDPAAQRTAVHPHLAGARPVVPGPRALLALAQRDAAVPGVVVERQMRAGVRHDQLHRHGDVERIVAGAEGTPRVGVPQTVGAVPQPRPRRPAAEPEEAGVRGHFGPLHPARRTAVHRLPPARRKIAAQDHTTGGTDLHRPVPGHLDGHALRHHPPAAVLVGLQRGSRIRLGRRSVQRVRRLRFRAVPSPEDGTARGDADPQLGTGEPDDPASRQRLRTGHRTGHPGTLRTPRRQFPRVGTPLPPGRAHRAQPLHRSEVPHRAHQTTTIHAAQPAIRPGVREVCSTPVHPWWDHIFPGPTMGGEPWCERRSHGIVRVSRVTRTPRTCA